MASPYPPRPTGGGKATMIAMSGAASVGGGGGGTSYSLSFTTDPATGTIGSVIDFSGTVLPSGQTVEFGLSTTSGTFTGGTFAGGTLGAATVSGTLWNDNITLNTSGTFYPFAEITGQTTVVGSGIVVSAPSAAITYSLLSGSGNGGLVGDTFSTATGAQAASNWGPTTTIPHTTVITMNIAYTGSGSGTIDHAVFWFDSSATNVTAPGSGTLTSSYNSGVALSYSASNAGGIYPGNGTPGTYYGTYAFYNASNVLLGVVKTNALTIT